MLGFDRALDGDEMFRDVVLARIIEPTSKVDALRVLSETGLEPPAYRTLKRRLPVSPNLRCAKHYRKPALRTLGWDQPPWCSTTSLHCISKPN